MIKSFTLLGKTFRVINDDKHLKKIGLLGLLRFDEGIIYLRNEAFQEPLHQTHQHTFLHELVHAVLYSMGEAELCKNEKFVDVFAGLLQQFHNTKVNGVKHAKVLLQRTTRGSIQN